MTIRQTLMRSVAAALVAGGLAMTAPSPALAAGGEDALDAKITDLHQKLQITADQEKSWKAVTDVMRKNSEESAQQVKKFRKDEEAMTAVADLNAYADITEAHAKHIRKLAKAFEALYAGMTDDQKKAADAVFREHKQKAAAAQSPAH